MLGNFRFFREAELFLVVGGGPLLRDREKVVRHIGFDDDRPGGNLRSRAGAVGLHRCRIEFQFCRQALDLLSDVARQAGIEKTSLGQDVGGFLQAIQFMGKSFRFIGEGLGYRHQEIELFFRCQAEGPEVAILHKREGHRAEGLRFANAEGKEEVVMGTRLFRRHEQAPPRHCTDVAFGGARLVAAEQTRSMVGGLN